MRRVSVDIPRRPYDVVVGAGVLDHVAVLLADRRAVAVVTHPELAERYGAPVAAALRATGATVLEATMPPGEDAKSLATVERLCRELAAGGLLRRDAVVAIGGGVLGDTVGFAASVYHRGVDVVQVPTTLLAQVDAAVGGKTAVNLPEGKNLVGAFHQPVGVVADVDTLMTVPEREYRAGLGEVVKYSALPGGGAVDVLLRTRTDAVLARDPDVLIELVATCVAMKAAVVASDPEERTGARATLNYGHTLAHALETVGGHDLLHGEAVAIGLVYATALAERLERVPAGRSAQTAELVAALGLPTHADPALAADDLLRVMARDKKAAGGLTFVLPGIGGGLESVDDPPAPAVLAAFAAVGVTIGVAS